MGLFSKKKDGPKDGDAIPGADRYPSLRVAMVFAKVRDKLDDLPPSEDLDLAKERAFLNERKEILLGLAPRGDYRPLLAAFADYGERITGDLASLQFGPTYSAFKRSVYDFPIEDKPIGDPKGAADAFLAITKSHFEIVMLEERIASIRKRVERLKATMAQADPGEVLATLRNLQGEKLQCEDRLMKANQSLERMRIALQMTLS